MTGTANLIRTIWEAGSLNIDWAHATKGQTGILAFFVYCWAALPYHFLAGKLYNLIPNTMTYNFPSWLQWLNAKALGVVIRGMVWGLLFMVIEFIIGYLCKYVLGWNGWDYSKIPLNILGIVTFAFYPIWTVAGMMGEWLNLKLLDIDDVLVQTKK